MEPFISSIIETAKGFLMEPVETFQKNRETSLAKSFQYYAALVVFYAILISIVEGIMLFLGGFPEASEYPFLGGIMGMATTVFVLLLFVFVILACLTGIFFKGAFQHIFVLLFGGECGIAQTLKTGMFAATPVLTLGWIPIVNIIAAIWSIVLMVIGIRELHNMSTGASAAAVLLPIVFGLVIGFLIVLFFIALALGIGVGLVEMAELFEV